MKRNIFIFIGGIGLSFLYIMLCTWLMLNFTLSGKISAAVESGMAYKDIVAKYGDIFKAMEGELRIIQWAIFPTSSILIGSYVGILAQKREVLVSVITFLPILALAIVTDSPSPEAYLFGTFYLGLSCFTTHIITRFRKSRSRTAFNQAAAHRR